MATTFLDLQTEVTAIGPFGTTTASAGRIKLWLNHAQHWFLAKKRWSFLESSVTVASVSGQADCVLVGTAPVVTDFDTLIDVQHNQANAGTTFIKLREMQQQDFDDILAIAGATPGIPIFYTLRGATPQTTSAAILAGGNQRLSVWPVMNYIGSLKIGYFRSVASCEMTANTDISIIPIQYQSAIIYRAAAFGLASKGQILQAQSLNTYSEELATAAMQADSVARNGDMPIGERPEMPGNLPPSPALANPANSPYGLSVR